MTDAIETSDMTEAAEPVETPTVTGEATGRALVPRRVLGVAVLACAAAVGFSTSQSSDRDDATSARRTAQARLAEQRKNTTGAQHRARHRAHRRQGDPRRRGEDHDVVARAHRSQRAGDRHARGRAPARDQHARRRRRVQRAGRPRDRPDDADGRQVQGDPAVRRRTAQPRHGSVRGRNLERGGRRSTSFAQQALEPLDGERRTGIVDGRKRNHRSDARGLRASRRAPDREHHVGVDGRSRRSRCSLEVMARRRGIRPMRSRARHGMLGPPMGTMDRHGRDPVSSDRPSRCRVRRSASSPSCHRARPRSRRLACNAVVVRLPPHREHRGPRASC